VKKEFKNDTDKICGKYDWRYIYNCYKKVRYIKYGFAEPCFLYHELIFSE